MLSKNLVDGGSGFDGTFPVTVTCNNDQGPFDGDLAADGTPWTVSSTLPTCTECDISEDSIDPPTGYRWTVFGTFTEDSGTADDGTVVIPDTNGAEVDVTVNNTLTRNLGKLVLSKNLVDGGSGFDGTFPVTVTCNNDQGPFDGDLAADGTPWTVSSTLPTGTECDISEDSIDPPTGYRWTVFGTFTEDSGTADDGTVVIPDTNGAEVDVTVNNTLTRNLGKLVLSKNLVDGGSGFDGTFPVTVTCNNDQGPFDGDLAADGTPWTVSSTLPPAPSATSRRTPSIRRPVTGGRCSGHSPRTPGPRMTARWSSPTPTGPRSTSR